MNDTRRRLEEIFQDVFDDDDLELKDETTAADVEGWDSFNNVKLVVQAEAEFGIKFKTSEVANLVNVGQLIELIDSKRA